MKEEPMQDDHQRDAWLGPMLRQAPPTAPDPCVDAETLAAWAEGTLDTAQTAAVERHASSCSQCMALMASIARTTPPPVEAEPERPWAFAPLMRWLVPLTAAATAIAIWVVVPRGPVPSAVDRPATSAVEVPAEAPAPGAVEERIEEPDASLRAPEPQQESSRLAKAEPAPQQSRDASVETQSAPETARADAARRNEARERQALDAFAPPVETLRDQAAAPRAAAPPPAAPSAATPAPPPSAAPSPSPSVAAPSSRAAAGAINERFTAEAVQQQMQQQMLARAVPTSESTAPADPLIQWRVMGWVAVERSIDGGKTWIKTTPPPGVVPNNPPPVRVVSVRAVDNLRAVVVTTENREFYTTNGGILWERVQENSAAPF